MLLVSRHCDVCATETQFEVLGDCTDHGADCPEVICVDCGAVYLCGPWAELDVVEPSLPSRSRQARRGVA